MDVKKVEKFIELMKKHKLHSLEFSDKVEKIVIVASNDGVAQQVNYAPTSLVSLAAPQPQAKAPASGGKLIKSPFVGTFYGSSSPGSEPFVTVGKRVKKGDTLCIIEAMKLMNEIEADANGVIREILAENAQPVEYDQPLFVIE